jgi:8-oxo-dGTP pyrophosphatase MutT (NUDIX family)
VAHYTVPVKPPAVPVPAATLVLLRDTPDATCELLLIRRHTKSAFAGGDHVFPGGKVGPDDNPADADAWCAGLDADEAASRLGVDRQAALAYWIGAIRETFEEVGVLLAYDASKQPVRLDDRRFEDYRAACQQANRAFWDMVRGERLTLATDALVHFAHWITPEESPLRFDTRFFAAVMPAAGQEACADGREITEVRWLSPEGALAAAARGEISLRNPTMRNIELFIGARSAAEAVAKVTGREVTAIRPRVVMENGERRILMPGDAGYY